MTDLRDHFYQTKNIEFLKNTLGKELWIQVSGNRNMDASSAVFWAALMPVENLQQIVHLSPGRELFQQFADLFQIAGLSLGVVTQRIEVALQILPVLFRGMHFGKRCLLLCLGLRRALCCQLWCGLRCLCRTVLLQQLVHR